MINCNSVVTRWQ